jgi:chorismate mutase
MAKIKVKGTEITVYSHIEEDYICITDIARHKNAERTDDLIRNWIRNRNTIEFLGIWEILNNPDFKPVEFDGFKKQAGLNSFTLKENLVPPELSKSQINHIYATEADILNMALFGMTAAIWRETNPDKKGNIRDYADVSQLVCLSNLENLNALFINDALPQDVRLERLNKIAIQQMRILTSDSGMKRLEGK